MLDIKQRGLDGGGGRGHDAGQGRGRLDLVHWPGLGPRHWPDGGGQLGARRGGGHRVSPRPPSDYGAA